MQFNSRYNKECNVSLSPGDGNSDTLRLLQQPAGVSRGGEDQEGAGCHSDDGGHQYASCTEHDCTVQPGGETIIQGACALIVFVSPC